MTSPENFLTIRGRAVRFDEDGLACLNDIWRAAGFSKNQRPSDWIALYTTHKRVERVLKLITGKSGNYGKEDVRKAWRTKVGAGGGTWADPRLALDYAEYLNPALAIEVKEVFLRYKANDPTLADEVLQNASAEANEWAGTRALGRSERIKYTDELKVRGVKTGYEYGHCTNETYQALFRQTAAEMKASRGLKRSASLRDSMTTRELVKVAFSEVLSIERTEAEDSRGFEQCRMATRVAASSVRVALESNKRDSQPKLM